MEQYQYIFERMNDDLSRLIFRNRLLFYETNDVHYLQNIVAALPEVQWLEQELKKHINQDRVLFGAGWRGERMANGLSFLNWRGVIDNDKDKIGQEIEGIVISDPKYVIKNYENPVVVVSNKGRHPEIRSELAQYGVDESNIIFFSDKYTNIVSGQYFDLKELPHTDNEVFIDCGGYCGETSIDFINWSKNNYRKIYCFEPDSSNFEVCKKNLSEACENLHKYEVLNKGLWDKTGCLSFISNGHVSMIDNNGEQHIDVVSLDDVLCGENVTFIKMDIEGAEMKALEGAKETIRKCRPKLAIAIYHRSDDIIEIPNRILELCEGYKFYLRHYHVIFSETVLYAIPVYD